jgi:hypothetical protein
MKYILSQYLRIKIRRKFTHAIERNWEWRFEMQCFSVALTALVIILTGNLYSKFHNIVMCLWYWRRRSDYYFVLFTTSLVVTTITFTVCALHFHVDSLSWLVLWLLASWLLLWSLVYLISRFVSDRLLWSAFFFLLTALK